MVRRHDNEPVSRWCGCNCITKRPAEICRALICWRLKMGKCTTVGTQLDDATAANTSHAAQIALDGTNITNIITLLNDIRSRLIGDYLVS